ncbi:MAG: hypothetical protein DMG40_08815 [Acidobacteria bacterium]|nr:MAG: hypothetical protein DMG40_08815 [Acidobacteriota bacterium]
MMKRRSSPAMLLVAIVWLAAAAGLAKRTEKISTLPFGAWTRASNEPIISPQGTKWESAGTFNPAVAFHNGKFVMLYRAQDAAGTSRLGYAESTDGIHFTRRPGPVFAPETAYEKEGGVEDPRLQKFGDTFYLTYTGYNRKDAQLCLATSHDLIHWDRKGVVLPAYKGNWNKGWTKSGAIVPEKIDGKYWMYWLGTAADKTDQAGLSWSTDLIHWTEATQTPVLPKRPGKFDSRVVEPGPPPILTKEGIVLIYNGADDQLVYRTGVAIFDSNDPRKVLSRSADPIFAPEKEWEKVGQVPNVVFVEGMVRQDGRWLFYYGGADKYVGVAGAERLPDAALSSVPSSSPPASEGEVVTFPSGDLSLHGTLYKPSGAGPFPAVVYNHGGAPGMLSKGAFDALGPVFAKNGWVFFGPYRRGQGLSSSAGKYIGDEIASATKAGGLASGAATMVRLLETDHLNDQLAALAWLRTQKFVEGDRIAVAGNSFGGIEAVLGAERGLYCAAIDSAGGAQSWSEAPELQSLMTRSVRNSHAPIFFFQAENDYDLSPSRVLSNAMKDAGKEFEVKIYPPYGESVQDGHTFGYFGSSVWAGDVFRFLNKHCPG